MKNLKKHVLFEEAAVIQKYCSRLEYLGIAGFYFLRRFPNGTFVDLSNQLAWSENFLTQFFNCELDYGNAQDHIWINPGLSLWSQNPGNMIWQEGKEKWGFYSGISIAKEGPAWTDAFCFYSRKEPSVMDQEYLKNFQLLEKFNLLFVDKFQDIINKGEQNPLHIPEIYFQNKKPAFNDQEKFIQSFMHFQEPLSKRELECIYYIAKGNTAFQVGKILHLSRRTVETHLQKAKDKLLVTKTSDLIKFFPEW